MIHMESETNGLPQPLYASEAATLNGKDVIQLPLRKQDVGNSMNKSSTMKSIEDGVAKKALQSNDEPRYSNFDDESLSGGEDLRCSATLQGPSDGSSDDRPCQPDGCRAVDAAGRRRLC